MTDHRLTTQERSGPSKRNRPPPGLYTIGVAHNSCPVDGPELHVIERLYSCLLLQVNHNFSKLIQVH